VSSDRFIVEPGNRTLAVRQAALGHGVVYIKSAPTIEVLFDQLEYLVAHESQVCAAGCEDCVRLKQVEGWLLQPFRAPESGARSTRAAATFGRILRQRRPEKKFSPAPSQ
jgi:hypothetical protein